mgnify:FL=1
MNDKKLISGILISEKFFHIVEIEFAMSMNEEDEREVK